MKKILKFIFIIIVSCIYSNAYASTNLLERNENNNYGINKKIEITNDRLQYIKKTKYVNANEKIYDFSDILTNEEEEKLFKKIQEFIEKTKMDLVILTDNLEYTNDIDNDYYAVDFYDYNDFGINKEHYDGAIFFRNTYEKNPYFGSYMTGNAMLYFSNERNDIILDNIYNDIHSGNYYDGIIEFINELIDYYNKGIPKQNADAYIDNHGNIAFIKKYNPPFMVAGIIALITSTIIISIMIKKNKMVYQAKEANEYLNNDSIKYNRKETHLISTHTTRHYNPPSNNSGGGSHSFGGSSSIGHSGGGRHG